MVLNSSTRSVSKFLDPSRRQPPAAGSSHQRWLASLAGTMNLLPEIPCQTLLYTMTLPPICSNLGKHIEHLQGLLKTVKEPKPWTSILSQIPPDDRWPIAKRLGKIIGLWNQRNPQDVSFEEATVLHHYLNLSVPIPEIETLSNALFVLTAIGHIPNNHFISLNPFKWAAQPPILYEVGFLPLAFARSEGPELHRLLQIITAQYYPNAKIVEEDNLDFLRKYPESAFVYFAPEHLFTQWLNEVTESQHSDLHNSENSDPFAASYRQGVAWCNSKGFDVW